MVASVVFFASLALLDVGSHTADQQDECRAMRKAEISEAAILYAEHVPAGDYVAPDGRTFKDLPAFCRVVSRAQPSSSSNILIEVWLPVRQSWNGKFLGTGNGGFGGKIEYAPLAGGLRRGYAAGNSDTGTYPAAVSAVNYDAGNDRPDVVKDWAYRATHLMTVAGKELVDRFYGTGPRNSYFSGCSTGGHQGLTEAQRYPDDYDGIVAGAAGHNRTRLHAAITQIFYVGSMSGASLSEATLGLFHNDLLRRCVGRDGGASTDTFLNDPSLCIPQPEALQCERDQIEGCLSKPQVRALGQLFSPLRNPRTGQAIYFGIAPGSEMNLSILLPSPSRVNAPAHLTRWIFGSEWDETTFDFDKDMEQLDDTLAPVVNAMNPDLNAFAKRGGKLLMFHGWEDTVVRPLDSILYFSRATSSTQGDFARLFMVPGMGHCSGGPGPNYFGQRPEFWEGKGAAEDALSALDHWVTTGQAPSSLLARKFEGDQLDGMVLRERPLCAYPGIARQRPGTDPNLASSFTCVAGVPAQFEWPAPTYLR